MNGPASLRGVSTDRPATRDEILPRDLELFLPADLSFPRSNLTQAMLDVLTLCVWALLGCLGALIAGGPLLALGWILFCS
jgi:hypothetical protein